MFKRLLKRDQNVSVQDPTLPIPGTSKGAGAVNIDVNYDGGAPKKSFGKRCCNYMYDKENKLFCGRSCKNWFAIVIYSITYLIFLSTYTLIFMYSSLSLIKYLDIYETVDKIEFLKYSSTGIGLSATPTGLNKVPLISYVDDTKDYQKYVDGIDEVLMKRRKRGVRNFTDLGPCGVKPYGYGREPCVIIRINNQNNWAAKPLYKNMTQKLNLPLKVRNLLELEKQKLWLNCDSLHSDLQKHIGHVKYYPDPPGFDPELFPLHEFSQSPLVAVQFSNFTLDLHLAIECKVWYQEGISSIKFTLYVKPKRK